MRINYLSPVAISLAVLPRMLARGVGNHRQRVEPRWAGWGSRPRRRTPGRVRALAGSSESMAMTSTGPASR